jgi:nucleoside-diphosphate-sugar epimerase
MHVLVIGAAGMLGAKLVSKLASHGKLAGQSISRLTRYDAVIPPPPPSTTHPVDTFVGDLADPEETQKLADARPDVVFHLAAIVSGEAEKDFDKGYRINLDATRNLLEALRMQGTAYKPKLIFTSSIAVFGAPFPEKIPDDFFTTPLTSYGTQKAMGELLVSDYSRKGFIDGMSLRMPTVCVRPGRPNLAASGFFSNIIREPLVGKEAILPVPTDVRHWHVSPRSAVGFLIQAANMDSARLGNRRTINLPGLSCTVEEQIEALRRAAGDKAVALVRHEPDETIMRIVQGWPRNFDTARAKELGFKAEQTFDEIIRVHMEDELAKA